MSQAKMRRARVQAKKESQAKRRRAKQPVKKRPAMSRSKRELSVDDLFYDEDGPVGLIDEDSDDDDEDDLDVRALWGGESDDDIGEDEDDALESGNSPLYDVIHKQLKQLPTDVLLRLVAVWQALAEQSKKQPLKAGSGCTGSGLDFLVIKTISEVLAVSACC